MLQKMLALRCLLLIAVLLCASPALALADGAATPAVSAAPAASSSPATPARTNPTSADDLGFADAEVSLPPPPPPSRWSVTGTLRSDWAMWSSRLTSPAFAKGRQSLDLAVEYKHAPLRLVVRGHGEYDFAYLHQRERFDEATLATYERQFYFKEAFAALSFGRFELTAGYQIVGWGKGTLVSLLDVISARDGREPGQADLIDLHLPTLSTRLSAVFGNHHIEALVVHLPNYGLRPSPNGIFSPLPAMFDSPSLPALGLSVDQLLRGKQYTDTEPSFAQQFFLRYSYSGHRLDASLYAASLLDTRGILVIQDQAVFIAGTDIVLDHPRYTMLGHAWALAAGQFILRWELGVDLSRPFTVGQLQPQPSVWMEKANLINSLASVSFNGIPNVSLTLEVAKVWMLTERSDWLLPPDRPVFAMRAAYSFLDDRLQLTMLASVFGLEVEQGAFLRTEATVRAAEGLRIHVGYTGYWPGQIFGPLTGLTNHDRIYTGLRWDFSLL